MLSLLMSLLVALTGAGQAAESQPLPEGWQVRADGSGHAAHAAPAALSFVEMPPGWHVTTGPSVILYQPTRTASGTYRVSSETYLFDPGTRREGYGVFIGGRDLDGSGQTYTYFLVRRTGEFLVKTRRGNAVSTVKDWTAHPAIVQYDQRGTANTAKNVLGIEVTASEAVFTVNGQDVTRLPRAEIVTDGIVGLRVNHELNLHVSTLEVTPGQ